MVHPPTINSQRQKICPEGIQALAERSQPRNKPLVFPGFVSEVSKCFPGGNKLTREGLLSPRNS